MTPSLLIALKTEHPAWSVRQVIIERFFRTVRDQLLAFLTPDDGASLDALNGRLGAYLEGEYHRAPHSGLHGSTPHEQWAFGRRRGALRRCGLRPGRPEGSDR